jgi:hypothetical protein
MTGTIIRAPGATFGSGLPPARVAESLNCLGYYLFGVDQESSARNRIPGGADLVPIGAGPHAYGDATATLSDTRGFETPFTVTPFNFTVVYVNDRASSSVAGTATPPGIMFYASAATGAFDQYWSAADEEVLRGSDANVATPAGAQVETQYWGTRQHFRAIVETNTAASLYIEEGHALHPVFSTPTNHSALPATAVRFGGAGFGTGYTRMSAAAVFNRALSEPEIRTVYRKIVADLEARGVR